MLELTNQNSELSAGAGIREELKARYARENIERGHQHELRVAQQKDIVAEQREQPATDYKDPEADYQNTETVLSPASDNKKSLGAKVVNSGKHYIIGAALGLISFGLFAVPYTIYRLVWGKKN